ncbi:sterol carrier family protein [Streptomyces sp. ACT015]|uniref:sterol carrier family protein n=1 Tax=Streptomyces sp. ACT015 TaxID=3134807 RepID=UPI003D16BDDE
MPPAKKRPRSYDPARTRAAVLAQFGHLRAALPALTPARLAAPTRVGDLTVGDLAARPAAVLDAVARALAGPEPAKAGPPLAQWPLTSPGDTATAAPGDGAVTPAALADRYEAAARRLSDALAGAPGGRLVETGAGALPLGDHLVTRAVELVVLTDDLNAAVPGLGIPFDRQALAACTRLLADALAVKAPGGSTEVRVPPFAVVQCVEGPRHTRGTPPNVVETDPLTWIRLATGRLAWRDALDDAKVSAGGERADLGGLLPLTG